MRTLEAELASQDVAAQQQALTALTKSRHSGEAALVIAAYLAAGQPDALADAAVEALGQTKSSEALPMLGRLRRHRRAGLRQCVYAALAAVPDDSALPMLVDGLRDSDAGVRAVAAGALGDRHATGQLDPLFHALARGVPQAADSIGRIAGEAALERYHGYLETLPLTVMLDGYRRFLERRDVSEAAQLDIVARLGEVASPAVKSFLQALLDGDELPQRKRLRFAIEQTAERIAPKPAAGGKR